MPSDRIIQIEPFSGISGDMFVGALLDLGVDLDYVADRLRLLPLQGYRVAAEKCMRAGIRATKFHVHVDSAQEPAPGHHHGHHHGSHAKGEPHRGFGDIRQMIEGSRLSPWVIEKSVEAFRRLAEAEGKIHNIDPEKVHFHEVGAVDSIVDIVGGLIAAETFLPARFLSSPVNVGRGTVHCRHGIYPVPAPATQELLRGVPTFSNEVDGELATPTGAALLVTLVTDFSARKVSIARAAGYGAGGRETPGNANVLRISLADEMPALEAPEAGEAVAILEADIDDMSPQIYGYFQEKAFQQGALDVYATAIQMKKNRPGLLLTVVCPVVMVDSMASLIFAETTTIGIRYGYSRRKTLERRFLKVQTAYGPVTIKESFLDGRRVNFVPEYEECRGIAVAKGIALKEVLAAANRAYLQHEEETGKK